MDRYKILCLLGIILQLSLQAQSIPHPLITDRPPVAGHDRFATEEDSSASTSSASSSAQSEEAQSANAPQASSASLIYEDGGYHPKSPPKPTKETPQTRPPPPQSLHELRLLCNLYREFHPPGCRMDEPTHRQNNNNHRGLPAIIPPPPGFVPPPSSEERGDDEREDMLETEDDDDVELVHRNDHHQQQHQSNNNRFHQNRPQVAHLDHNLLLPPMIPRDRQESEDDDNNDDYNPRHYQDQQDIHRNGRLPYPPLPPPPPPQHRRERPRRPSHLDEPSSKPEMDKLLRKSMIIVPDRSCPAGKRRDARGYCRTVIRFQQYSNPGSSQRGGPGRFFYRRFVAVPALHFIIP